MNPQPPDGAGGDPAPVAGLVACPVCLREIPSPEGVYPYGHTRREGPPVPLHGLDGRTRWEWRRVPCPDEATPRIGDVRRGLSVRRTGG